MAEEVLRLTDADGVASVEIDVERGGRLRRLIVEGVDLLVTDPPPGVDGREYRWGSFPMAPWAGRVRDGRFTWFGAEHRLHRNADDSGTGAPGRRHAMHGTVFTRPWTVEESVDSSVTLRCDLDEPTADGDEPGDGTTVGWRLGGTARQCIELLHGQLRCDLEVSVDPGAPPVPATIGWHPWFVKPDRLDFHPDAMYERDDVGLPTGRLIAPPPGPWDDCFVNTAPVTLHYDRDRVAEVTVSSDCDHWVVFDRPEHATCVEPQSGPPDEFNLRPQIVSGTRPLRHTMIVGW